MIETIISSEIEAPVCWIINGKKRVGIQTRKEIVQLSNGAQFIRIRDCGVVVEVLNA